MHRPAEQPMGIYRVAAQNFATEHDNRIHSDEVAKKFGFEGALVPGVAVFGHLTYPLVERYGSHWLNQSSSSLRLRKPAYDGDELEVELTENADGLYVTCSARGELLADLQSQLHGTQQAANPPETLFSKTVRNASRAEITWESITPNEPFAPWQWQISADVNRAYCAEIKDELPLYQALAHPHWLLSQANTVLTREYEMPAWIHVGSEMHQHGVLNVGDEITVRAVPLEKWRNKGHEFIKAYVAYERAGQIMTEIVHTAIYKVAA